MRELRQVVVTLGLALVLGASESRADVGGAKVWLEGRQNTEEGPWVARGDAASAVDGFSVPATAEATLVLGESQLGQDAYTQAEVWLRARKSWSTSEAAAIVESLALTGADTTRAAEALTALRRGDGLWGERAGWEADLTATAEALRALGAVGTPASEVQAAIDFLVSRQRGPSEPEAGAWGLDEAEHSAAPVHVHDTALVLLGLLPYESGTPWPEIDAGIQWLLDQQNPDGGFRDDPEAGGDSTVAETALVLVVLCQSGRAVAGAADDAVRWLEGEQDPAGHWRDEDVLLTARAARALTCGLPNLLVAAADLDVSPGADSGATVTLSARVTNDGLRDADIGTTAQYYLGRPDEGGSPIGSVHDVAPLAAQTTSPIELTQDWTASPDGLREICIRVDEGGLLDERSELDNLTCKTIAVGARANLTAQSLRTSPAPALLGETFDFIFEVANTSTFLPASEGELDSVVAELWEGTPDPENGTPLVAWDPVAIPQGAGQEYATELGPLSTPEQQYCVRTFDQSVDPSDEIDPNDNQTCLLVTPQSPPNLTVERLDLVVLPEEPESGEEITVTYGVRNTGSATFGSATVTLYAVAVDSTFDPSDPLATKEQVDPIPLAVTDFDPGDPPETKISVSFSRPDGPHQIWAQVVPGSGEPDQSTADDQAYRLVSWAQAQSAPVAVASCDPCVAAEGDALQLDATGSSDADEDIVVYEWDLDGDGEYDDAAGETPQVAFVQPGMHEAALRVTDSGDRVATDQVSFTVTEVEPTVLGGPEIVIEEAATAGATGALIFDPGLLNATESVTIDWDGVAGPEAPVVLDFGLGGTWRFDDDVTDASGLGRHMTLGRGGHASDGTHRSALSLDPGPSPELEGTTLTFDGLSDDFPDEAFTIACWLRTTSVEARTVLSFAGPDPTDPGSTLSLALTDPTNVSLRVGGEAVASGSDVTDGSWHHVVATWRSRDARVELFVDGNLPVTELLTGTGLVLPADGTLMVGQDQQAAGVAFEPETRAYRGDIDELRIYGRALTLAEVQALHANPPMIVAPGATTAPVDSERHWADDADHDVVVTVEDGGGTVGSGSFGLSVENRSPTALAGRFDLDQWTAETYLDGVPDAGAWSVTDVGNEAEVTAHAPHEDGLQRVLVGPATVLHSQFEATVRVHAGHGEAEGDYLGFVLGYQPGGSSVDHVLVDWKGATQGSAGAGLAAWRVTEADPDVWTHASAGVEELARATNLGSVGWADDTDHEFLIDMTPRRLRVLVDGVLELDIAGCFQDGRFALYEYSQANIEFRDVRQTRIGLPEGGTATLSTRSVDVGLADTIESVRATWGDADMPSNGTVEQSVPGTATASDTHVYVQDGLYEVSSCVTDDDGGLGCDQVPARVYNVPPVVDAGDDVVVPPGTTFHLTSTFTDAGVLDLHEATVDWGDGSALEMGAVEEAQGAGTVEASHDFAPGVHEVTVCVSDDAVSPCLLGDLVHLGGAFSSEEVYFNDFTMSVGPEWSAGSLVEAPSGEGILGLGYDSFGRALLFDRDRVELQLTGLAAHDRVRVDFDFHAVRSWDGHCEAIDCAPDLFKFGEIGGEEYLHATFATHDPRVQTYPESFDPSLGPGENPEHPPHTGAVSTFALGWFGFGPDSNYEMSYAFPHAGESLGLYFEGYELLQPWEDEGWALDDVRVVLLRECHLTLTDTADQRSRALLPDRVSLEPDGSFSTTFSFRMTGGAGGHEGLAFILHADPEALGATPDGAVGGLGADGIGPSLIVEVDPRDDGAHDLGDGNHLGINVNGQLASEAQAPVPGEDLDDGRTWQVWVDHDGATDTLEVRLADDGVRPVAPLLTHALDVLGVLGTRHVFAGFTAATPAASGGRHEILSWDFHAGAAPYGVCTSVEGSTACDVVEVTVNRPPACVPAGPYTTDCSTIEITDAKVIDPDGDELTYQWSVVPAGAATVSPPSGIVAAGSGERSIEATTVTLASGVPCGTIVTLELTVSDGFASAEPPDPACSTTITFDDAEAPTLEEVPPDTSVQCNAVPAPASVTASDNCDANPDLSYQEVRTDGPCPHEYTLTRTWTATDACDKESQDHQVITVEDTTPPTLIGVPADETVECDAVPPPANVTAEDACDDEPVLSFQEVRTNGACPHEYTLTRTWTATDACGNESQDHQVITVQDTTPPVITASDERVECLWPPNHEYVVLDQSWFAPDIMDNCSAAGNITWVFTTCTSNQPDDDSGNGDGDTVDDCVVATDGLSFQARAERAGREPGGRDYTLHARATDECGNESAEVAIGRVHVPHDHRRRSTHDCISAHD